MKTKPHLAFSELTRRVYIVYGKEKEDVTDLINTYATKQKLLQHGVSGKRPTEFTIEEVIESIKTLWMKYFGRLDSNSPDRDGYFVCGFVREALKAACASGAVDKSVSDGYKEKYEKCIKVIKRFDAGIIGMYDL